ncbi:phosphoglycerate kinase [Wolbachia endosymbiont of Dirofilaria (Dirofilaria) immitis]|uniref:phosphoglycerate kinase n=1 Tax=Wolbachia endosymbiont of Dirofilaria (Dirofilaria) immitis TaxID=1812115 RepID=UPI00158ED882|nr:phosphoglycerate kinase [Wolbachia endosymbiont of Dirofilaria (Dirofilaria) immitis]QKX02100.1 phosphoglycerate kinase [Wolbachia endosymbiont of Dirofilaria (Dirofilaria) immitis]
MDIPSIESCNFQDKTVLLRVDFNVSTKNGKVYDITRILRTLPTIQYLINAGAKIIIISHFGHPKAKNSNLSLRNMVEVLSQLLKKEVKFIGNCIGQRVQRAISLMDRGDVILLENLRFYRGEERNDLNFAKQLASLADIYVNDAFSCSHRAHASILCITEFLPSYAGFCFQDELKHLERDVLFNAKPITVIIGGAKVSTKIKTLIKLAEKVDYLILGGAIANNFLLFNGVNVGKSFFQNNVSDLLCDIVDTANKNNCKIIVPGDVLVAINSDYSNCILRKTESILDDDIILDIGPQTLSTVSNIIASSKTLLWSGPIGVFEYSAFANGTIEVMRVVSNLTREGKLISIIGGGDSLSAINAAGLTDKNFTYVSTGGGAFLSWLSGDEMPGVAALQLASG